MAHHDMDDVDEIFVNMTMTNNTSQSEDWLNPGYSALVEGRDGEVSDYYMMSDAASTGRISEFAFTFNQRVVVACLYCSIALTGLIGNSCVVLAVFLSKKLHNLTNVLIVNLSATDFLTCVAMVIQAATLLTSDETLEIPKGLCILASILNFVCICTSLLTLTLIAFMRWYVITRGIRGHQGLHTPRKLAIMLVCSWTLAIFVMLLPPAFAIGTLGYSVGYKQCFTTDDNERVVYYSGMQGIGCLIFIALSVSFYFGIFWHVRKNNISFCKDNGCTTGDPVAGRWAPPKEARSSNHCNDIGINQDSPKHKRISILTITGLFHDHGEGQMAEVFRKRELRITKNLLVVFCLFVVCFLPTAVSLIIPGGSLYQIYANVLLFINACINPFIYGLKHDQFKEVLKPLVCCRCSEIPEPTRLLRKCRKNRQVEIDRVAVAMTPDVECFSKYMTQRNWQHHRRGQAYTL